MIANVVGTVDSGFGDFLHQKLCKSDVLFTLWGLAIMPADGLRARRARIDLSGLSQGAGWADIARSVGFVPVNTASSFRHPLSYVGS